MNELTLCASGKDCSRKYRCLRYRAKPNGERQSWADFPRHFCLDFVLIKAGSITLNIQAADSLRTKGDTK